MGEGGDDLVQAFGGDETRGKGVRKGKEKGKRREIEY